MTTFIKCLFLLLIASFSVAQNKSSKLLQGKIVANSNDLEGIYVLNLKTDHSTLTEKGGYFSITASVGDTLLFSAVQFKGIEIILKENDFEKELLFVKLETIIRELDEVKVNQYKNINAVSLGIVPKGIKVYTPAERKLYTATTGSGLVSVDGIINMISGRTAMLKTALLYEKKETLLNKLSYLFEDEFFSHKLKIPTDYVQGFKYYIVENDKVVNAINAKNKTLATFLIGELAVEYLELLNKKE
jgi:hypothetical protein